MNEEGIKVSARPIFVLTCCIINMFNFVFVTEFDIVKHFHKIKSNAIGLDNIHSVFLKYMLPNLLPYIDMLYV